MKRKAKKTINIRHYKSKQEMNIGIVLFAFIFIYLIVTLQRKYLYMKSVREVL